jgi:UDPglucose--hexose-1-phosphate uridylyltransferase
VLQRISCALGDPDYNLVVRSMPGDAGAYAHWYVTIVPRVSRQAGFELGSGMYINTALPEESARVLRAATDRPTIPVPRACAEVQP